MKPKFELYFRYENEYKKAVFSDVLKWLYYKYPKKKIIIGNTTFENGIIY